jgi:hypothetical protein
LRLPTAAVARSLQVIIGFIVKRFRLQARSDPDPDPDQGEEKEKRSSIDLKSGAVALLIYESASHPGHA